jgi:formate hydrogenlyase subunit 3/multisubunit Na+/H+ antiporter MnhD subunit
MFAHSPPMKPSGNNTQSVLKRRVQAILPGLVVGLNVIVIIRVLTLYIKGNTSSRDLLTLTLYLATPIVSIALALYTASD